MRNNWRIVLAAVGIAAMVVILTTLLGYADAAMRLVVTDLLRGGWLIWSFVPAVIVLAALLFAGFWQTIAYVIGVLVFGTLLEFGLSFPLSFISVALASALLSIALVALILLPFRAQQTQPGTAPRKRFWHSRKPQTFVTSKGGIRPVTATNNLAINPPIGPVTMSRSKPASSRNAIPGRFRG